MAKSLRRKRGMILFISVLLLALMGALAIAALDTSTRDRQAAGFYNRSNNALFAADAGVAAAVSMIKQVGAATCPGTVAFSTQAAPTYLGDTATYAGFGARPRYYGDPSAPNGQPVVCAGTYSKGGSMTRVGSQRPAVQVAAWWIYVVGESPDGSRSRIQVMKEFEI